MIEREFRVLNALEGVGFPAPRVLALALVRMARSGHIR